MTRIELNDRLERQRSLKSARFNPQPARELAYMSKEVRNKEIVKDFNILVKLPQVFTKMGYIYDFLAEKYVLPAYTICSICGAQ